VLCLGSLASGFYELAKHPEEQRKLLLDEKFVKGSIPTYEETQKFEYIPPFIREVMRLYSPVTLSPTRGIIDTAVSRQID